MNGNLERIAQITDLMADTEWVESKLTFCDPSTSTNENTFADCVLRTPNLTILRWFVPAGDQVKEHQHDESFEILICERGELPLQIDGVHHDLNPGEVIRIPPGVPHGDYRLRVEDSIIIGITIPPAREFDEPIGADNGRSNAGRDPNASI